MTDDAPQLRGEVRKLSSVSTEGRATVGFFFAVVCTVAALVAIVVGKIVVALALLGVSVLVWFVVLVGSPKVVETDGYWLLATDFSKTVWIPLRQIVSVDQDGFHGARRVYVKVGCDTPFGREIVFEPQFGLGPLLGEHPVVQELRALAAHARAAHRAVDGAGRLPKARDRQHDDDPAHQAGREGDRRPVPALSGAVSPAAAHDGASLHPDGARWPLSSRRVGYGLGLGCLGVIFVWFAGFAVLHHGPWPTVVIPVLFLIWSAWKEWPVTYVETDGRKLFLARRSHEAEVALTDVEGVEVDIARGYRQALRVTFRHPTPLGSWVTIEVPMDWMSTAYDHRSARELRALVAQAKAAATQDAGARGLARGSSAR